MLMEKYHWTPQQIDEIPKQTMDIIMLAMNQKLESESGQAIISKDVSSFKKEFGIDFMPNNAKIIGGPGIKRLY